MQKIKNISKGILAFRDDDGKEQVLTQGTVKVVSLGVEQKKPVPLPEAVYDQFAH